MIDRITTEFVGMPSNCFSTDIWSSRALGPYISFCLILLPNGFQMQLYALENKPFVVVSHTGEATLESLEKSIEDWSEPKAVPRYVLQDNCSNMRATMKTWQNFMDLLWFAHTLQLLINDAVLKTEGISNMITKCKNRLTLLSQYSIFSIVVYTTKAIKKR